MRTVQSTSVCVDRNWHGEWEVGLPERAERVSCQTIDEALRIAYGVAGCSRPCELIVRDAYHRVVRHELMDGSESGVA